MGSASCFDVSAGAGGSPAERARGPLERSGDLASDPAAVEVTGLGGFILLVCVVWAIVSIFGSAASSGSKAIWIVVVLLLPLLGFIIWLFFGPRAVKGAS